MLHIPVSACRLVVIRWSFGKIYLYGTAGLQALARWGWLHEIVINSGPTMSPYWMEENSITMQALVIAPYTCYRV